MSKVDRQTDKVAPAGGGRRVNMPSPAYSPFLWLVFLHSVSVIPTSSVKSVRMLLYGRGGTDGISLVVTSMLVTLTRSSTLLTQPYALRDLFYREETILQVLRSTSNFYKSQRLEEYLTACSARIAELDLLENLEDEVR